MDAASTYEAAPHKTARSNNSSRHSRASWTACSCAAASALQPVCNEDFEDDIRSMPTTRSDQLQFLLADAKHHWQLNSACALVWQQLCHCWNSSKSYVNGALVAADQGL